jgi:hypothetical protein
MKDFLEHHINEEMSQKIEELVSSGNGNYDVPSSFFIFVKR